jgi:hypothetical protein
LICESVPDIAAIRIVVWACDALPAIARASAVRQVASRRSAVRRAIDWAVTVGFCAADALLADLVGFDPVAPPVSVSPVSLADRS